MMKRMRPALITGITGHDGSYLAEQSFACSNEVHVLIRHAITWPSQVRELADCPSRYVGSHGDQFDSCETNERSPRG